MPSYLIATTRVIDNDRLQATYAKAVTKITADFGGKYLMVTPSITLEGEWGDGTLIIVSEWPDRETLERFWNSPEYAEAKAMREGLSEVRAYAVDGDLSRELLKV